MKKKMIVTTALALVVLAVGAASAAEGCNGCKCGDEKALKQLSDESAPLSGRLETKYRELSQAYGSDSIDISKVNEVEAEIRILKDQIRGVAERLDIPACKLG